jgi:hypothetical protein
VRRLSLTRTALWVVLGSCVPSAESLRADDLTGAQAAAMGGAILAFVVVLIAAYVYFSLALKTIAEKTHTENPWWAWIPVLQAVLMLNIARKPVWWILLLFVPFVNIVFAVIVWMAIAEARNKPGWWGILVLVPVANLIIPGYLAWSD